MIPARVPHSRHVRYRVRHQARRDAETHATLAERARTCHRQRSAILRPVMPWGLTPTRGWTSDHSLPATVRTVALLVELDLLQPVQAAAAGHGATVAAWLRQAMRRVTSDDVPTSWQAGGAGGRSHESGPYQRRWMLRRDDETSHP
jgi:hypothetical protein